MILRNSLPLILIMFTAAAGKAAPKADQLRHEIQKTKESMTEDDLKQRKILGTLFEINHKMKKIVSERSALEQERMIVEGSVKDLATKIKNLETKTKYQRSLLRKRLLVMYKLGGQGVARLLFSSASSAELERSLKILGVVAKQDVDLIKDYSQSRRELEARKQKLTIRWTYLKKVQSKIRAKEQKLADENAEKNKILQNIRTSQNFAMMKLRQLRKKSRQIASEDESGVLDLLFQPSFFEQKGQLPRPIQGHLMQGFGLLKDEVHKVVLSHKGHFYAAPVGTPVKAVFEGKVAFAGLVPGFGHTLILDHGDHYYSVYSHNKMLQVRQGDEVKQSQVLALSGTAGEQIGDGLYFEIRHFSEPSDPNAWMKGNTL